MRDPARRERREVSILVEDVLRAHIFLELDQKALLADEGVKRKEGLHRVAFLGREEAFAERRDAEIDKGAMEAGATEAACTRRDSRRWLPIVIGTKGHGQKHSIESKARRGAGRRKVRRIRIVSRGRLDPSRPYGGEPPRRLNARNTLFMARFLA